MTWCFGLRCCFFAVKNDKKYLITAKTKQNLLIFLLFYDMIPLRTVGSHVFICHKRGIMKKNNHIILLRILLCVLIIANMTVIFIFSAQNGKESDQTSNKVTQAVAEVTVKDFDKKPASEQTQIIEKMHLPVRKIAHMLEFGTLGALTLLLLLTWAGSLPLQYAASLLFTFLYACTDEWHQSLTEDRGPGFQDVLIDLCGALITCTLLLCLILWIRHHKRKQKTPMQITHYQIPNNKQLKPLRIAVASDLHGCKHNGIVNAIAAQSPDLILIPGDLMDDENLRTPTHSGYDFLASCAKIAPTFYSLGNHELACYHRGNPWRHPTPIVPDDDIRARIAATGATLLDNESVLYNGLRICGLSSGINGKENHPNAKALQSFSAAEEYRILLCHHPEYFMPYIKDTDIELTLCGHAHGGHWRFFGHGVYAPGQGLFPKYTSGVLENRCVISRGLSNHTRIPRICNPTELIIIEIKDTV